ncbi:trypsin-like peptidase domain-containing protein [Ramlibacter sp. AW1]|uniref:Trypsin-like peptidase domain-containing protein n=1 Tax=Ramlibacter aurantiacus TaxID=2801330 RepID=A0A936ZG92_9BURK|nr:trypsin-like peptidase domain-containing protein [Ramlibacter aurantiacus]MBL0420909.1 trypsin-like peptidase domain-containing protein [Ramlibacter aurantiacus]
MRRTGLYSSSRPSGRSAEAGATGSHAAPQAAAPPPDAPTPAFTRTRRIRRPSSQELLWVMVLVLATLLAYSLSQRTEHRRITQDDINAAVLKTLETQPIPSEYARAYETIRPSVVRVVSYVGKDKLGGPLAAELRKRTDKPKPLGPAPADGNADEIEAGVGTGVVIIDKGVILTNLHVVSGADRIKVTFHDGMESTATITGVQPENDLAVLQAQKIPDDMIAATMRSTADLLPGDKVVAVGFPFGIGPSGSAGVVSGLKRVFKSPESNTEMRNLIQFDAAANPGNSGGPLVTMDGHLVGIVTAILNPTSARTFLGIGFAVPIENAATAAGLPPF